MPYDETLSGSIVDLPDGSILEFGDLEYGFDDILPYGLANAATWSVRLNFSRLPPDLQGYLRNKYVSVTDILFGQHDRYNTFMYWTDSGTNGSNWTLLFVGVVENTDGADYDINPQQELEVEYNLIDGAYHTMLQITGDLSTISRSAIEQTGGLIYDYYAINGRSQWRNEFGAAGNTDIATAHFKTWSGFMDDLRTRISGQTYARVARSANILTAATSFDYNNRLYDLIDTGVRLQAYNTDGSGDAFANLGDTNAYILQYIVSGGEVVGGLYSDKDEYSVSQAQCMKDIISDLCETFCVKMYWKPEYVVDAGGNYIKWDLEVSTLLGNKRGNTTPTDYSLDKVVSIDAFREGAGIIGKAETRVTLEGDDKNVTEFVTSSGRSRSERSINIEPILNNLPTPKNSLTQRTLAGITYKQRESIGVDQTNSIFSNDGSFAWGGLSYGYAKAHHDTKVVVRGSANGGAIVTSYDATSSTKPTSAEEPQHIAWMNEIQTQAGIPKALSKALFNTFNDEFQCELVLTWPNASNLLIDQVGAVHDLEDGLADVLTQYNWDKACVVAVRHSFSDGTTELTYLLPSV
jgi:hypothetical protein